jgi:hypothetical protein
MPHVYLEGPRGQTSFLFNDVPFHERYLSSDQDSLAMVLLNRAGRSAHAVVSSQSLLETSSRGNGIGQLLPSRER